MTGASIAERFAARARAAPDAPAIRAADGRTIAYGEVDRRSAALAGALLGAPGARPADPPRVLVVTEHSAAAVVALLGGLRAGVCVVPVGPHESDGHLRFVAEDADVAAVVTDDANAGRAERFAGGRTTIVVPDDDGGMADTGAPDPRPDHDALAAIVYTSGSTGRPKGVTTPLRSLDARVRQYEDVSGLVPADRQASWIPASFAAAFPDVLGPLVTGASVLPLDLRRHDPDDLLGWARREEATLLNVPIALLRRLLSGPAPAPLPDVRLVNLSGDRLDVDELSALFALLPDEAVVVHGYGSTETNLVAQRVVRRGDLAALRAADGAVPVGRPVDGKTVQLLDGDGALRGERDGVEGEVAVGGPFVTPGYWNRPEETRAAFVETPAGRLYRTGDRGRIGADGELTVLGRLGTRVKVRGQRVDLAAVERVLRATPGVRNAVVDARPADGANDERLVAWVEPADGASVTPAVVRREVRARAPSHWVPARVAVLPSLPLTASGKVDRGALPSPEADTRPGGAPPTPPRTDRERRVAALFAAALEVEAVGLDDRYFDLGGDSLALAALLAAVETELDTFVPLDVLTEELTVRSLAALEDGAPARTEEDDVRPPRAAPRHGTLRHGPYAGDRALPYGIGVRLQRAVLARAAVQRRWFSEPLARVAWWRERLAPSEPKEETALRSILANTWVEWRARALARPGAFEAWVDVEGRDALAAAFADPARGVVLVVPHTGVRHARLLRGLPALAARELASIHRDARDPADRERPARIVQRTRQLRRARAVLARGGVAVIAGDGVHGAAGVDVPFLGGTRRFRFGAAELATATGAALVPLFSTITARGRVGLRFEPALTSAESDAAGRVADLTRQVAARFEAAWPGLIGALRWGVLRRAAATLGEG